MINRTFILLAFLCSSYFAFSQKEEATPIHFIKVDLIKFHFCQVHFDYERYNGKHLGTEVGVSWFLPNRLYSYVNENQHHNLLAFRYTGVGIELKEKFYLPLKSCAFYAAPQLSASYQYFNNSTVYLVDQSHSSSYTRTEQVSSKQFATDADVVIGFMTKLQQRMVLDISGGIGMGYVDVNSKRAESYPVTTEELTLGQTRSVAPVYKLSVKICFGIKGKKE